MLIVNCSSRMSPLTHESTSKSYPNCNAICKSFPNTSHQTRVNNKDVSANGVGNSPAELYWHDSVKTMWSSGRYLSR